MSSTSITARYCKKLNQWFEELDSEVAGKVLKLIEAGYRPILEWVEINEPDLYQDIDQLQDEVHKLAKELDMKEIRKLLKNKGLKSKPLLEAMLHTAGNAVSLYKDSAYLRQLEPEDFRRIASITINDIFIERRTASWDSRHKLLAMETEELTEKNYRVIVALITQHYTILETLEELEHHIRRELEFSELLIECFSSLIISYRQALDHFFLLRKMNWLERAFARQSR